MVKTHWVRNAVAFGAALTLSVGAYTLAGNAQASTLCGEMEMAGISLSLDKYYMANIASQEQDVTVTETASAQAEGNQTTKTSTDVENTDKGNVVKKETTAQTSAKNNSLTKEEKMPKKYETMGISIANDYVNIRKFHSTNSKIVGKLYRGSAAKILETGKVWVKVESGSVTGYIHKEYLAIGKKAYALADKFGTQYASVREGTITLNVRAKTSTKSTILTQIPEDTRYEALKTYDNWVKIDIDGDKGYVAKKYVNVSTVFKKAVSIKEEKAKLRRKRAAEKAERERLAAIEAEKERAAQERAAQERAAQEAQRSASSSSSSSNSSSSGSSSSGSSSSSSSSRSTSSSSGRSSSSGSSGSTSTTVKGSGTGAQIAAYAQQFVGNPYVYGGSSLTRGTDCSGFTMSVYAQFGYSLPHNSGAQSGCGRSVSLSSLQPGDLVFYKNGSTIGHVAIYIGGGRVCHASNERDGIKISPLNYRKPACARRIVG